MRTEIIKEDNDSITIKVNINNENVNFLETEEEIMREVNNIGKVLTKKSLELLDEDETIIEKDGKELYLHGSQKKVMKHHLEK